MHSRGCLNGGRIVQEEQPSIHKCTVGDREAFTVSGLEFRSPQKRRHRDEERRGVMSEPREREESSFG